MSDSWDTILERKAEEVLPSSVPVDQVVVTGTRYVSMTPVILGLIALAALVYLAKPKPKGTK